jgi:CelD/BcsL family acetyltransferase involved in cellulose biosynthesis
VRPTHNPTERDAAAVARTVPAISPMPDVAVMGARPQGTSGATVPDPSRSPTMTSGALDRVVFDPLADARWADLLTRAPDAAVFHHPAWLRLLHAEYRYRIEAWCVAAADGRVVAGLPVAVVNSRLTGRRLVALPFSDHCRPLIARDAPDHAEAALAAALDELRRRRGMPLEVRGSGTALSEAAPGARFHHHVLALEPDDRAVEQRFRKPQVRRGVRRALREGLTTERRTDAAALAAFYRLHVATRARLGVPTQPRRFILRFADLFAEGMGFILIVKRAERPAAAAVFLTFGDVLTYKYGASDAELLPMRPNNLLFSEAIRWGCDHGMRALDLGRTDWGQEGLRAFKLAWGAEERELSYRHLVDKPQDGHRETVARVLGPVLRHSPPLVSRVLGEVVYRHAA